MPNCAQQAIKSEYKREKKRERNFTMNERDESAKMTDTHFIKKKKINVQHKQKNRILLMPDVDYIFFSHRFIPSNQKKMSSIK